MTPLPIWENPDEARYMGNVGDDWKTPAKIASYVDPGFIAGFPDSYRCCDRGGGDFGFRAPPSFVLNGNWRTVLTRRISDVFCAKNGVMPERTLDAIERGYERGPEVGVPEVKLAVYAPCACPSWYLRTYVMQLAPAFHKAIGWRLHHQVRCVLRIGRPDVAWAVVGAGDPHQSGTCAILSAVPRAEAIEWINSVLDAQWKEPET